MNWSDWEAKGVLAALDAQLGRFLGGPGAVGLAAALVSRNLRDGHVCLELSRIAEQALVDADGAPLPRLPSLELWRAALERSDAVQVVGAPGDSRAMAARPLVLDRAHRLYFSRYFEHEQRLARALGALLHTATSVLPSALPEARLDHYFGSDSRADGQRQAAESSLTQKFLVISGGPGTGKTSTVVKILALLVEQARERAVTAPRVLLLAPTGKAAARLKESIAQAKQSLGAPSAVLEAITEEASTIHRALGMQPDSQTRFRRTTDNPLPHDVVLVDEASMVDLSLMRHLVEALRPEARLILLGDRHQLASVQAGSVLSELCMAFGAQNARPDARVVVELTKSYRFSSDSGIFSLAEAVRLGRAAEALQLLERQLPDLGFLAEEARPEKREVLREVVVRGFADALSAETPRAALDALGRFRVLCAHRSGAFGVDTLNELCRAWLAERGVTAHGEFYQGRPLLITQNDYTSGLFNGDLGIVWAEGEQLWAYFEGPDGLRKFSIAHLPEHETAFAITIHKSQGSEYDEVVVVLPEEGSPLLSRELLYTAITRARRRVVVSAGRSAIEAACQRSVARSSGLRDTLTQLAWSRSSID